MKWYHILEQTDSISVMILKILGKSNDWKSVFCERYLAPRFCLSTRYKCLNLPLPANPAKRKNNFHEYLDDRYFPVKFQFQDVFQFPLCSSSPEILSFVASFLCVLGHCCRLIFSVLLSSLICCRWENEQRKRRRLSGQPSSGQSEPASTLKSKRGSVSWHSHSPDS